MKRPKQKYVCSRSITPVNWTRNSLGAERKSNESHTFGAAVAVAIAILVTFVKCVFCTMQFRTFPISVTRVYTLLCLFFRQCFIKLYCVDLFVWIYTKRKWTSYVMLLVLLLLLLLVIFFSVCRLLLANTATNKPSNGYSAHTHNEFVCARVSHFLCVNLNVFEYECECVCACILYMLWAVQPNIRPMLYRVCVL